MPEVVTTEPFDLNQAGNFVRLELNGSTVATVQVSLLTDSTPSAFVVTIQRSLDGEMWSDLEESQTIAFGSGFTAAILSVMSDAIDCSGFKWIRAVVTTVEGGALLGRVRIYSQRIGG